MNSPLLFINGIDASSGDYLTPQVAAAEIAAAARGEMGVDGAGSDDRDALDKRYRRDTEKRLGPIAGTQVNDLASAGWGVVFASDIDPAVVEALQPLIDLRSGQAKDRFQRFAGREGYQVGDPNESVRSFLRRRKVLPSMPADPQRVPYYLMVVGSPAAVPFRFQYGLDVVYAVGRLWFENIDGTPDLDAFDRYARAVVAAESESDKNGRTRRAVFVGVGNEGDEASHLSLVDLVQPLGNAIAGTEEIQKAGWDVQTFGPEKAGKHDLAGLLDGSEPPALLFTASHGVAFPKGHPLQLPHQGALLCQDWPGPRKWRGAIPAAQYLAADDISRSARLAGMIAFHFACFGAGTPALDDFAHLSQFGSARALAARPFVARLPQRLLSQGALAVIGHVERAWSCSFHGGDSVGRQLQTLQSVVQTLLEGHRVGWALEYLGALYAALATELTGEITREAQGQRPDDALLADLWTAHNDARGFVVLGDPAVKLASSSQANLLATSETPPPLPPSPPAGEGRGGGDGALPSTFSPVGEGRGGGDSALRSTSSAAPSDDEPAASLPLSATERRFQAWDSVKGAATGEDLGPAPGSSSFSFSAEGVGPGNWATPNLVDEQKLFRQRNDPERVRKLLRRRGMTDQEIMRATGAGPVSFATLPADPESAFDEQVGLERILGKRDLVESWFLEAGARAARAVGRVRIRTAAGHTKGYGTASLIGPGILLTNHHVLPDEACAAASTVEFGVEEDAGGRGRAPEAFALRPELLFLTDTADGDGLDFTLIAVAPKGESGGALSELGWNRPMEDDDPILVRQYVNIIQHPQGQPKQVALRDNQVIDLLENFLHYRADTEPGSSGAPVFNDYWELVGLHHSGVPRRDPLTREILTRWGAVWDRKNERDVDWIANEGVRLSRILTRLKVATLHGEASRLRDALLSAEPGLSSRRKRRPPIPEPDEPELAPPVVKLPPTPTVSIGTVEVAAGVGPGMVSVTIPLQVQVDVRILSPESAASTPLLTAAATTTRPVARAPDLSPPAAFGEAVTIDPDYGNRCGYDPEFLGTGRLRVELPQLDEELAEAAARVVGAAPDELPYELKYHHFSAVVHRERQLAIFAAVNIEGDRQEHQTRESDRWIRDPRIDSHVQVGNEFYKGTPFDRGHLVRRIDPAWGPDARVAKVANDDTFHFTNCAPQHKKYNRSLELWRGLEDFLIERALEDNRRINVFTGPLFNRDQDLNVSPDPEYAGVKVPRWYWKVAVLVRPDGTHGVLGFLVSQADLANQAVAALRAEEAAVDVASTFQVPVARIGALTGLDFGPLISHAAPTVAGFGREAIIEEEAEIPISEAEDIRIQWMDVGG